ncbi:hypothetical protein DSECCO2_25810 [anaerobic digester metagenome]
MKIVFFLIGIGVIALWWWGGGVIELSKDNGKNVESIEALFTGLAFLGMMAAIYFQKEELKLQREELFRQGNEMETQRKLAQEYQDERFFVLLLEQIDGDSIIDSKDGVSDTLDICYRDEDTHLGIITLNKNRKSIEKMILRHYGDAHKIKVEGEFYLIIDDFVARMAVRCNKFQVLFDKIIHIHDFINSINDIKVQENYARIAYNCIGQYDRIIVFMYLVAKLKLQQGDILGDLLFNFYNIEIEI